MANVKRAAKRIPTCCKLYPLQQESVTNTTSPLNVYIYEYTRVLTYLKLETVAFMRLIYDYSNFKSTLAQENIQKVNNF